MPDLEPITRDEMLWSGEDVEPITRREMYIRHLYDETQVIPDKPITREEMFILKAGEELHDVTIEQLNVSENGAYSESGKAYSPVIVDVPLPENAYLLKDIQNTPCDIATFTDGANLPMPGLKVSIEPTQSGSGDPSPSNIRPISGWSAVNVIKHGANQWDEEYKVSGIGIKAKNLIRVLPNTTYYFESPCDVAYYRYDANKNYIDSLTLAKDTSFTTLSNQYYMWFDAGDNYGNTTYNNDISINYPSTDTSYHAYNGHTTTIPFTDAQGNPVEVFGGELDVVNGTVKPNIEYDSYNGETLVGRWISDRDVYAEGTTPTIGAQVVDLGAYGSDISVQPTSIKSLEGVNNVWGDCGQIKEGSYFSESEEE